MKAVLVSPPRPGVRIDDIPPPKYTGDNSVLIRMLYVGICGTDREIVNGMMPYAMPPHGKDSMILGHEALGIVEKAPPSYEDLVGEYVVPIVRRGCGKCINCLMGRADFCETGNFLEAGIRGLDGFMAEYVVDSPKYLVRAPKAIRDVAVLAEPLSGVMKSYEAMINVQRRMSWLCEDGTYSCRNALVIGTGPIGMLASMLFKTEGFKVTIVNKRDLYQHEKNVINKIGIKFYNSVNGYLDLYKEIGAFDLVFDTTADPKVFSDIINYMNYNSVIGLFGFARYRSAHPLSSEALTTIAIRNIGIVGLINSQKEHFKKALEYIALWTQLFPGALESMITSKIHVEDKQAVVNVLKEKARGEIKIVITLE